MTLTVWDAVERVPTQRNFAKPKSRILTCPSCDEDVLGLEIAMDDSFAVRRGEAVRYLQRVFRRLPHRQRRAVHLLAQRPAFEQFTREIRCAFVNPTVSIGKGRACMAAHRQCRT